MSEKSEDHVTIGALGKATGVNIETIRYYERIGLLPEPKRTAAGYRSYGSAHVKRLAFIRRARDLGFPIDTVRVLLGIADDPGRSCAEVDRVALAHLEEVERKIADLIRLRDELRSISLQCRGGVVAECRIIEALTPTD